MHHIVSRRGFLTSATALCAAAPLRASAPGCLLLPAGGAGKIRDAVSRDGSRAAIIRKNAAAALKAGPWSVTFHRPDYIKADAHEYYSEGPYWWPDPRNPGGPYIRKDGERNPDRYQHNRKDLGELCQSVLALGMGARFLGGAEYADRAAKVLSVWFLDAATRMSPDLEFGQAVRGVNTGRGTGLIDTVSLIHLAQGVMLIEDAGMLDKGVAAGVRRWYADFAYWMNTSKKGLDEKKAENNHGTWWTAQIAAYATFTNDNSLQSVAWDRYRSYLVPTEVKPDGSCPREEARTKSLSYSSMNLDGFSVLCCLGQMAGQDLWRFRTPQGTGIEKSFYYVLPYVIDPAQWHKQQIAPYERDSVIFPGLAGAGLHSTQLLAAYRKLPRAATPWVQFIDLLVRSTESVG
jgi:Alginate lyase